MRGWRRRWGEGLVDGLVKGLATEVRYDQLVTGPPAEDPAEQVLERLRNHIAATWDARLERDDASGTFRCETQAAPFARRRWRIALGQAPRPDRLGAVGAERHRRRVPWDSPPSADRTGGAGTPLDRGSCLGHLMGRAGQHAPSVRTLHAIRAVLARLMGPRAFLTWLRTLLNDVTGEAGDDPWPDRTDEERPEPASRYGSGSLRRPRERRRSRAS